MSKVVSWFDMLLPLKSANTGVVGVDKRHMSDDNVSCDWSEATSLSKPGGKRAGTTESNSCEMLNS